MKPISFRVAVTKALNKTTADQEEIQEPAAAAKEISKNAAQAAAPSEADGVCIKGRTKSGTVKASLGGKRYFTSLPNGFGKSLAKRRNLHGGDVCLVSPIAP